LRVRLCSASVALRAPGLTVTTRLRRKLMLTSVNENEGPVWVQFLNAAFFFLPAQWAQVCLLQLSCRFFPAGFIFRALCVDIEKCKGILSAEVSQPSHAAGKSERTVPWNTQANCNTCSSSEGEHKWSSKSAVHKDCGILSLRSARQSTASCRDYSSRPALGAVQHF